MLNEQSNERVLFSGYAKLPVGITAAEMYKVIGVIVVVDMKSGLIVKADCTLASYILLFLLFCVGTILLLQKS